MKMTPEHYALLKERLDQTIEKIGIESALEHRKKHLGKDIEMRFRWDLFWTAYTHDMSLFRIYKDDHIDTAIKKYIKEHPVLGKDSN